MCADHSVNHDEDVSQDIMESLSAALLVNPRFNFAKLMDLSMEINSEKNKSNLSDVITLAFLNYLEMHEAAELLGRDNIAAEAGFAALNLGDKTSLSWFIRFLSVMNPGLVATISQTLMSVVNGLMIQNTRSNDADRLQKVQRKLNKFVDSGEAQRRIEAANESKPEKERKQRKAETNIGLLGWMSSVPKQKKTNSSKYDRRGSSSSSSKSKTTKTSKATSEHSAVSQHSTTLRGSLSALSLSDNEVGPNDSVSNVGLDVVLEKSPVSLSASQRAKARVTSFREEESIISG